MNRADFKDIRNIDDCIKLLIEYYQVDMKKYSLRIQIIKNCIRDNNIYDFNFIFDAVTENLEWFPTKKALIDSIKLYEKQKANFDFKKTLTVFEHKTAIEKRMKFIDNKKMLVD